jgi:hypothetical protein
MRISQCRAFRTARNSVNHWYSGQALTVVLSRKQHSMIFAGGTRHVTMPSPRKTLPSNLSRRYAIRLNKCRSPAGGQGDLRRPMKMRQSPFAGVLYLLMLVSSLFNVHYIPPSSCPTGARTTPHVTARQKYMSSRHISSSCHPHFSSFASSPLFHYILPWHLVISLFVSSPLFSLYLTLTSCYLAVATSCNNFSPCFAIIRCLITTAQLPRHAATPRLTVATSSCSVLSCSVGAHFRFISYCLTTQYKADSTLQVPLVIRSDIYPWQYALLRLINLEFEFTSFRSLQSAYLGLRCFFASSSSTNTPQIHNADS